MATAPCICAAAGMLLFALLLWRVARALRRRARRRGRPGVAAGVGLLFASVFLLRLGVALYAAGHSELGGLDDLGRLYGAGPIDLIADSFVHALQTFSMDEDYTLYLRAGELLFPGGAGLMLYRLCVDLSGMAAPVAGGAILLDILLRIFPRLRYSLLERGRKRYVFTQLNGRSLQLARDIAAREPGTGIVFLDVGAQDALRRQAEAVPALCMEDRLERWRCASLPDRAARRLFPERVVELCLLFIDDDEQINLKMAAQFARQGAQSRVEPGFRYSAYVFAGALEDMELVDGLNRARSVAGGSQPALTVIPVQVDRDAILRLLLKRPPFLPLLSGDYPGLEICVVGSDALAEEAVCQCYWHGQLFWPGTSDKVPLTIHAVADTPEARECFEQRLRHRMPEAFDAQKEDCREAATFRFHAARLGSADFDALFGERFGEVSQFILCPGEDARALRDAQTLWRLLGRRELERNRPALLHCAVQSATLGRWLEEHLEILRGEVGLKCRAYAFGGIEDCYCRESVFNSELLRAAAGFNLAYESENRALTDEDVRKLRADSYSMNSSIAFAVHAAAKFYSAGLLDERDFPELAPERLRDAAEKFKREALDVESRLRALALLEHMRWSAYTRSCGWELVTAERMACAQRGEKYAARSNALKLHNCLLPMGEGRLFNRERDPAGPEREQPEWSREEADPGWDALDALSWRQHQFALRFYREHNADPGGDRSLPGLYNDYKEYDERMLRAIPNGVKRYLRDVAGANVGASANGSGN